MGDFRIHHIENYWKTLTTASNESFNEGDFEKALLGYKDALCRAEILNNHLSDCLRLNIPFIQVYIISCNNLSHTYYELGQLEEAGNMLKRVVYYLQHLYGQEYVNKEELQNELKRAVILLLSFIEKNGGVKKREELLAILKRT